jgi:glucose dehydrogenase
LNSTSFGKIGFYPVDGKVDGEPLYLSQLSINGGAHNVLYVVTEHDSIYAFNADTGSILWQKSALGAGETTSDDHDCGQITPEIGITNTPVIDRQLGAIFFVAMTKDATGKYHQRLHALNLATGAEMEGGPTEISATFPGTGKFSQNGMQVFDPGQYAERVGLLLMNGYIFLGWTSHCDQDPYTGWLMMYNETTLQQTSVVNLTPNGDPNDPHFEGGEGSIWQAGSGLAGDSQGNLYFLTANGAFDLTLNSSGMPAHSDYGNSFVKVSSSGGKLAVVDYFSPDNTTDESLNDEDLG